VIEDNKQLLKAKYEQAKALGAAVNASKARFNELRTQIEQWRMQRSAACGSSLGPLHGLNEHTPAV
jgi:kinesin family protein 6/9